MFFLTYLLLYLDRKEIKIKLIHNLSGNMFYFKYTEIYDCFLIFSDLFSYENS